MYVPTWEASEVSICQLNRRKRSCSRMFNFIGGNTRTNWPVAHEVFSVHWESDVAGEEERYLQHFQPEGGWTRAGKDSFIHIAKPGLSLSADKAKAGELECCQDQCTPLHDTNGNQKWGEEREGRGRGDGGEPKGEPAPRSDLSLYCIAIDLPHSFADIARAIRVL